MVKKGDTLIEVALAIGIFSMIAISIASVISSSTSGAQLSLETTLAREEVDAQAETLRFIHNAYVSNKENTNQPLSQLWQKIITNAITLDDDEDNQSAILQYSPQTCAEIYNKNSFENPIYDNAFVINSRKLSQGTDAYIPLKDSDVLSEASTYPRLIFGKDNNAENYNDDNSNLQNSNNYSNLYRAEGIYVIAVKDPNSTNIVNTEGQKQDSSAYYDFYIRTCWYGTGNKEPSTISTVIRLHDSSVTAELGWVNIKFNTQNTNSINDGLYIKKHSYELPVPQREGFEFKGWCSGTVTTDAKLNDTCNGTLYKGGEKLSGLEVGKVADYTLTDTWERIEYQIKYNLGYDSLSPMSSTYCYQDSAGCTVSSETPSRSGYRFKGWCTEPIYDNSCPQSSRVQPGTNFNSATIPQKFTPNKTLNLYAIWSEFNETITIELSWGSTPRDLDSHVYGQKSNNDFFHTYYGNKTYSEGKTIASLDRDITTGYGVETVTLNTLGGKTYYYYVHNYSACGWLLSYCYSSAGIVGAQVKVTNVTTGEVRTYFSDQASGSGIYWNVFAYKDGKIVNRQTQSSSPETSY